MEKIAILYLGADNLSIKFVSVNRNKSFNISSEINMPINLTKDYYSDCIIKPAVTKEILSVLSVYKRLADNANVTESLCFATELLNDAKNNNGFLNEIQASTGFKFSVLTSEQSLNYTYTAIINTFNKPKALLVDVSSFSTSLMLYNRRNILQTKIIPYGYENIMSLVSGKNYSTEQACAVIETTISNEISELKEMFDLAEDFEVIGAGNMFLNLGAISRKAQKYPLDIAHNYQMNTQSFEKVYNLLKSQDINSTTKVKGVAKEDSRYLPSAFAIMNAILSKVNKQEFSISKTGIVEGILFNYVLPLTVEKPLSDTLGYSLQVINEYYNSDDNNYNQIYELSMVLFKQLKVLHKLNRSYIKVLKIASSLINVGDRVNYFTREKSAFSIIQNSNIYGVSQNEIVLASFVVLIRDADNFSLSDWVRYKDLLSDEDLDAVKKLAVILKLAESLDITKESCVIDINCDILGDSVIMKTVVNNDASLEIKYAMLNSNEFKKAFNKNLEII